MADLELSKRDEQEVDRFLAWLEKQEFDDTELKEKLGISAYTLHSMKYKRRRVSDGIKLRMAKLYGFEYMRSIIESEAANA